MIIYEDLNSRRSHMWDSQAGGESLLIRYGAGFPQILSSCPARMVRIQKKGVSRYDTYLQGFYPSVRAKITKIAMSLFFKKNALAGDKDGREGDKRKIKWEDQLSDRKFDNQHSPSTIIHHFIQSSQSTVHRPIVQTV